MSWKFYDYEGNLRTTMEGITGSHDILENLDHDTHTQYLLLNGRSGGQSLNGGINSGDDITIVSTAHGTKGSIYFGAAGALAEITSAGQLLLPVVGSTGGLLVGGDVAMYRSSAGRFRIDARLGVGDAPSSGQLHVLGSDAALITLFVRAATGQSTQVVSVRDENNLAIFLIGAGGGMTSNFRDAATNATATATTLAHITTGVPVANFGVQYLLTGTTNNSGSPSAATSNMGIVRAVWTDATSASFKGRLQLLAVDSGGNREGLRIDADGSQALIGIAGAVNTSYRVSVHGGMIVNDDGDSAGDFVAEGDNDTALLFVDASADKVGVGVSAPNSKLDVAGSFQVDSITNDTGLAHGTYTPTLTNVANLDASTAYECQYIRVGNTVTVSGKVDIDPTTTSTSTQLGISLPISSNLGAQEDCAGTAFASAIAGQGAAILGDATNNRAQLQYIAVDVTNQPMYFTFTYQVI